MPWFTHLTNASFLYASQTHIGRFDADLQMLSLAQRLEHSRRYRSAPSASNKGVDDPCTVNPPSPIACIVEPIAPSSMSISLQSRRQRALQLVSRRRATHAHSALETSVHIEGDEANKGGAGNGSSGDPRIEDDGKVLISKVERAVTTSDFRQSRIALEKRSPTASPHQKTWAKPTLEMPPLPISLATQKHRSQAWRNTMASPTSSETSPVASLGRGEELVCATIETTSTVSVASLRASFNARASNHLPMPMTTKDHRVRFSLTTKKNTKHASPLLESVTAQDEERDQAPTQGVLMLKEKWKPESEFQDIASPERARQSPSPGGYDSSQSQNVYSNRQAEHNVGVVVQLGEEYQGHSEKELEPLPIVEPRSASSPIRSPSIIMGDPEDGVVCYRNQNTGTQGDSFDSSPTYSVKALDVSQTMPMDHPQSSHGESTRDSPLAQMTIDSSLVVDFDDAMKFEGDCDSFVDDDSTSHGRVEECAVAITDRLAMAIDTAAFSGQGNAAPSCLAIKESDSTSVYIENVPDDSDSVAAGSSDIGIHRIGEVLPTGVRSDVNHVLMPFDDCRVEKVYHDFLGDSQSSHFDRDGWPIRQVQFSSVNQDWKHRHHQREIEVEVFSERYDFPDNSQCFVGSETESLKSVFQNSTESRVLLQSIPSPGRNYRQLQKPMPFDPFVDGDEPSGSEDSNEFVPLSEEFSPVNWHADSFQQGFEI